jgi:hypothetical protein
MRRQLGLRAPRPTGGVVPDSKFLTAEEVSERYRGQVTVGTLRNWRAMRIGPAFIKIGKAVLYPVEQLDAWDRKNMVMCQPSRNPGAGKIDALE